MWAYSTNASPRRRRVPKTGKASWEPRAAVEKLKTDWSIGAPQ